MFEKDETMFDWINVEKPIKWTFMCEKDEILFGWIDVERPIKWMLMCEKMKPCSVESMLKDQSNGRSYKIKKSKKIRKKEKKIEINRKRKNQKNGQRRKKQKKKSLFSVVSDKMCVFCLYPIPDSQQCVMRGSCRRSILSGLLLLF